MGQFAKHIDAILRAAHNRRIQALAIGRRFIESILDPPARIASPFLRAHERETHRFDVAAEVIDRNGDRREIVLDVDAKRRQVRACDIDGIRIT